MGLFGNSYDWKAHLTEQEANLLIRAMEEMTDRDRFALGFQPADVRKGIQDRKTALQILKTKKKLSEGELNLICSCLKNEILFRQTMGQGQGVAELNNLCHALNFLKSK